jgi:Trypsin-co-occurring domain 1
MAESKTTKKSDGQFEILVPKRAAPTRGARGVTDAVTTHATQPWTAQAFFDVKKVDPKDMAANWQAKLAQVLDMAADVAAKKDKGWHIDEIEIGLTLSAKGELLFIAEAGAEASVKVTLKKS